MIQWFKDAIQTIIEFIAVMVDGHTEYPGEE